MKDNQWSHILNTLNKNPVLIPHLLQTVDGELLYCIRQMNPQQRFFGRTEPSSNTVRYALTQQDADMMGAGDAGSILLWSVGDKTYLERTPPPQPTEREALRYILTRWFRTRNQWPDLQSQPPMVSILLMARILQHVAQDRKTEITFDRDVPVIALDKFCQAIRFVIAEALGQKPDAKLANEDAAIPLITEQILYRWASTSYPTSIETPDGLAMSLWNKLKAWITTDQSPQLLKKLTPEEQIGYGFDQIRELLNQCIQVTFQKRLAYHQEILSRLIDRLAQCSQDTQQLTSEEVTQEESSKPAETPAVIAHPIPVVLIENQSSQEEQEKPVANLPWECIADLRNDRNILRLCWDGLTDKEIATKLGLRRGYVANILASLREKYGKDITPWPRRKSRAGK